MTFFEDTLQRMKTRVVGGDREQTGLVYIKLSVFRSINWMVCEVSEFYLLFDHF